MMKNDPQSLAEWTMQLTPVDESTLPPDQRDYVEKVRSEIRGLKVGRLADILYAYTTEEDLGPMMFQLPFPLKRPNTAPPSQN